MYVRSTHDCFPDIVHSFHSSTNTSTATMPSFSSGINVLQAFVFIVCLAMLIIQIVLSCKDYFSFKSVSTIEMIKVQDIDFPYIFICHKKAFNMNGTDYQTSFSKLTEGVDSGLDEEFKFIGWNGQTNLSTETYLSIVANLKNIDNIKIGFIPFANRFKVTYLSFKKTRINYEKGQCYEAIVDKYVTELSLENMLMLTLQISSPENMDIFMMDNNQFNGIKYNENSFNGDNFLYEIGDNDWISYDIELSATKLDPRDPGANCQDYGPAYEFLSYKECFDKKVEEDFNFLGCTLPWFTDNEEKICRHDTPNISRKLQQKFVTYFTLTQHYFTNSYYKPCKNPCETVKIKSQLNTKIKLDLGTTNLIFMFNPTVIMTKSIMKTSLFDVINNIGSSMGLWLGISIFSIFQSFSDFDFSFLSDRTFFGNIFYLKRILSLSIITFGFMLFISSILMFCVSQFQNI